MPSTPQALYHNQQFFTELPVPVTHLHSWQSELYSICTNLFRYSPRDHMQVQQIHWHYWPC